MGRMISGRVFDAETSKPLPFAVVALTNEAGDPVQPTQHTSTNMDGSFRITVDGANGGTHLAAKYTGYPRSIKPISGNTDFSFPMSAGLHLPEIEVRANESGKSKDMAKWLLWAGIAVSVAGIGFLIVSKTKN